MHRHIMGEVHRADREAFTGEPIPEHGGLGLFAGAVATFDDEDSPWLSGRREEVVDELFSLLVIRVLGKREQRMRVVTKHGQRVGLTSAREAEGWDAALVQRVEYL